MINVQASGRARNTANPLGRGSATDRRRFLKAASVSAKPRRRPIRLSSITASRTSRNLLQSSCQPAAPGTFTTGKPLSRMPSRFARQATDRSLSPHRWHATSRSMDKTVRKRYIWRSSVEANRVTSDPTEDPLRKGRRPSPGDPCRSSGGDLRGRGGFAAIAGLADNTSRTPVAPGIYRSDGRGLARRLGPGAARRV
jgi:hypothetical protein